MKRDRLKKARARSSILAGVSFAVMLGFVYTMSIFSDSFGEVRMSPTAVFWFGTAILFYLLVVIISFSWLHRVLRSAENILGSVNMELISLKVVGEEVRNFRRLSSEVTSKLSLHHEKEEVEQLVKTEGTLSRLHQDSLKTILRLQHDFFWLFGIKKLTLDGYLEFLRDSK